MLDKQDLEKLKSLTPSEGVYDHIGIFLQWQKDVLPLLAFSASLYNKFQDHTKHVVNATMNFRTEDYKLHIKIMIGIYHEAIPQLEQLIKKQTFKKRFPIIHFCLLEWRPLLQVPVAIFVVLATFLITRHFTMIAPSPNVHTQNISEKSYINISSQTVIKEKQFNEQNPLKTAKASAPKQNNVKSESSLTSSIDKAMSDYYTDALFLEANDTGSIIIKGHTELSNLVQFCPDEWVDGCGPNIVIKRKGDVFKLENEAIAKHQIAFNLQDANGLWLQISRNNAYVGSNLSINKGNNGSYFVYRRRTK